MTRLLYTLCLAVFISSDIVTLAQSGCDYQPSSKVEKLIAQGSDTKKYKSAERKEFLEKALEIEPECLPCLRKLGESAFIMAKSGGSFATAKRLLGQLVTLCPEYHSEPYYYLGAMAYADREYAEAEEYFEKFLRFPDSDPSKFDKDYQKKYSEVEEALTSVKAYAEIYKDKFDFKPIRVVGVSSSNDEYLPFISPDGELMFITRMMMKQAKGDVTTKAIEEFTWCKRPDINSTFNSGEPLSKPFNNGVSCGGATIAVDNKELIVAVKNPLPKNPNNFDLFSTRFELIDNGGETREYKWSELINLGPQINTEDGWESQPSLSGDGKTLFYTVFRADCIKDANGNPTHDIFYSKRQADGSWSTGVPLPAPINSNGQDKAPFMHSDSHTFYFSSDGGIGVGGMDIFYCDMLADGTFSKPKNLGYPINTEADELGIVVTSDGEIAYFGAKNFNGNKGWDVFQFDMPEKARPEKVMVLKGQVKDEQGNPAQNAKVELTYAESKAKEEVKVNNDDGSYAAIVKIKRNENVTLSVEGEGVAFNSRLIAKKDAPAPVVAKLNMEAPKAEANKPVVINDIFYATAKAEIEESSKLILDAFAEYLISNPTMEIEIRGHTDNIGDDLTNKTLSTERAFEVFNYLASKGVQGKRMTYAGFGKSKPIADNSTEEGRSRNRRTEFVIKKM